MGLAFTDDDPPAAAAFSEVELVIMPQPRSSDVLPHMVSPVTAVFPG